MCLFLTCVPDSQATSELYEKSMSDIVSCCSNEPVGTCFIFIILFDRTLLNVRIRRSLGEGDFFYRSNRVREIVSGRGKRWPTLTSTPLCWPRSTLRPRRPVAGAWPNPGRGVATAWPTALFPTVWRSVPVPDGRRFSSSPWPRWLGPCPSLFPIPSLCPAAASASRSLVVNLQHDDSQIYRINTFRQGVFLWGGGG